MGLGEGNASCCSSRLAPPGVDSLVHKNTGLGAGGGLTDTLKVASGFCPKSQEREGRRVLWPVAAQNSEGGIRLGKAAVKRPSSDDS